MTEHTETNVTSLSIHCDENSGTMEDFLERGDKVLQAAQGSFRQTAIQTVTIQL